MKFFSENYRSFLSELKTNNNREWFNENKKRYEEFVKQPFQDFVEHMIIMIRGEDPSIIIEPKDAMFRIYRDVRFSKNKDPYKTQMSAVIAPGGRKDRTNPGFYFEITADDIGIYGGMYQPDKDQLQRIREHIVVHKSEFESIIKAKEFKKKFGEVMGSQNKRLPKEFVEPAKDIPLLANKEFYYGARIDGKKITSPKITDVIMDYYLAGIPFNEFMKRAVG
ncbi:MAG: DUF2461 domain-containing protein [Melioribacteraceae bacterium]|nr:DUF2461 domain-containing protein [Melioribacteraceae bacterium]MCF8263472.1 DUF2461 domain-containing protein [Melioribacteraceae bacterium]MCF8431268.1 DUF2461 domain-containing protein [Melioribacteraceae bacterium]